MRPDDKPLTEILHKDCEENLSAAKKALKGHRRAYMQRRTDLGGDVIDIIDDGKIIERHRSNSPGISFSPRGQRRFIPIEEMALYQ